MAFCCFAIEQVNTAQAANPHHLKLLDRQILSISQLVPNCPKIHGVLDNLKIIWSKGCSRFHGLPEDMRYLLVPNDINDLQALLHP